MDTKPIAHNVNSKWRSQDIKIKESADFSSLLLSDKVLAGLKKAGYQSPSPIQIEAIPIGRFGKDLVVQAKSGTGKTLVFGIIALEMILPEVTQPQVLIIAPTREIAHQICSVIQTVGCDFQNLNCGTFIGGIPLTEDKENVSGCQVAVGTPGRIKQLIKEGVLKTNCIRLFVLDEADQLLENSFLNDVDEIFLTLPKDKQVIAASATYPQKLKKLADRYFRNPYLARLNIDELALLGIVHYVQTVDVSDMPLLVYQKKLEYLAKILTSISFSQCLVFCNLLSRVPTLTADIKEWGFTTTSISSNKEQADRLKAIDKLKLFKCKVLVSSDLTSRGIDAENVNLVVNFDLPLSTETYLHRVGRAGRYGSRGLAVTLILPKQSESFKNMENSANFSSYDLPDPIPQNLMNIRPKGFKGPEDGFEVSSEKSDCLDQQENARGNGTSESDCSEVEIIDSELSHSQSDLGANEEESSTKSTSSEQNQNGLCSEDKHNGQSDEKEALDTLKHLQMEIVNINSEQSQNGLYSEDKHNGQSDEKETLDTLKHLQTETVKSEDSCPLKNGEETTLDSGPSSSEENPELFAGIANFLADMQPSRNVNLSLQSGKQNEESLDSFYYQVFKSFADEHMPGSKEKDQGNAVSSDETEAENKPLEDSSSFVVVKDPVLEQTEKSERSEVSKEPISETDSESSSSGINYDEDLSVSDSSSAYNIRYSRSSSTSIDSEPVRGRFFESDYMVKGKDGWREEKLDHGPTPGIMERLEKCFGPLSEYRKADPVPSLSNGAPEETEHGNETVHLSSDQAHVDPVPPKQMKASSALSVNSVHRVPVSPDAESEHIPSIRSYSSSSSSGLEKKAYALKRPTLNKINHSRDFRAKAIREKRAQDQNPPSKCSSYSQPQTHVQACPGFNWQHQTADNRISKCCQETFTAGFNHNQASSCSQYCSRSCNTHYRSNCRALGNHSYGSQNHSSLTNMWHDTFSKQWQHIHYMCYSQQFNY